jgi:hypothetical protein
MKYRYENMPDKTKSGIIREVERGLVTAAVYFESTLGVPHEIFQDWIERMSLLEQIAWYMNFRNQHPKLFK